MAEHVAHMEMINALKKIGWKASREDISWKI
jgi:predicted RNA binding protein YcfA (HicA-like mRNA interferase family)